MRSSTWDFRPRSGPAVARLFHRLLALVFLDAWISLYVQLDGLIGSRGLLPAADFIAEAKRQEVPVHELPTIFWLGASDLSLTLGVLLGIALALCALLGIAPRLCAALSTALYLGYVTVGRTFLSFQWDNLLLECGAFALFLPRDRRSLWSHTLFRLILFKLYWESGIAKWESHLSDWQDGSAMTFYYETAPLPTALASLAHALPVWWHHLESWVTLGFELVVPFLFFGPRRARLFAFVFLGFFQLVNAATANYGFFCWLALFLHVFLLDDRDIEWLRAKFRRPPLALVEPPPWRRAADLGVAAVVLATFVSLSTIEAIESFSRVSLDWALPIQRWTSPLRLVNTYHLFGHITRERIEPEFQTSDGAAWTARDLRHKAGPLGRAPGFVAPHQPRLDFQLWFYGLDYARGAPAYVVNLLDRLCNDPAAVQGFFAAPLPLHPRAVRIVFWRYHFSRAPGEWWTREHLDETRPVPCEVVR